ncbi:MAG: GNAT family N-acetyltransferase [Chloroflexi bacterium]|nr:GNAT family N-acetyltransferase [Chloroflexota bacterium]
MPITYRPITIDEFDQFDAAMLRGFSAHPDSNPVLKDLGRRIFEPERSIVAFDGDLMVGTSSSITLEISVPGANTLPMGGITEVTVSPTHRRRGILTGMMRRQIDAHHERGVPLVALWASESLIYGRFGYGPAVTHEHREIDLRHTSFAHSPDIRGQVNFIDKKDAQDLFAPMHQRVCKEYPGMIQRNDLGWEAAISDPEGMRNKSPELFYAYYETNGVPTGYVMYRIRHNVTAGDANNKVEVHELVATDDEATAALWRFCFDIDLASTISVGHGAPIDDGLVWMLTDPRRLKRSSYDGLWLRLIDVPAALSARAYSEDGSLVIRVEDSFCDWNDGTWRIDGGGEGSDCVATSDRPDISLSAADLAAIYMGGSKPSELARAGRVVESVSGALDRADRMFAVARQPWNLVDF